MISPNNDEAGLRTLGQEWNVNLIGQAMELLCLGNGIGRVLSYF